VRASVDHKQFPFPNPGGRPGLAADEHLGQVVLGRRAEADLGLEAGPPQEVGQVGAELGEDGVADVAAGVADRRGEVPGRAVGADDGAGEGPRDAGQQGDGEQVEAAGGEHPADLAEGRAEVGDVLEGLGGQDQVEGGVGVRQPRQVLGPDAGDLRAGGAAARKSE
jgi:hypothetical protein